MEGNVLGIMEEPHVDDNHEEGEDLHVFVKRYKEENYGQALIEVERKDEVFFSTIKMADHITYGSANKIPYSSTNWVDRDTFKVKKVGDEEFNFCNNFFLVTDIALEYGQPQGFNLQQLDTFHTHEHEVHSYFFVFEDYTYNFDENQALGLFQKKLELFPEKNLFPMEESHEYEYGASISGWISIADI